MTYKHYIITRFNLRKSDWITGKKNIPVLTDQWHDNRFELFTNFCFSCVASQTNQNFEWLVFFDESTKPKYRQLIADLQSQFSGFSPIFVDGMDAFLPTIQEIVNSCNADYLITSRLDNDDCLSNNYVETVQNLFDKQDFMAFDFVNGYTLQMGTRYKLGHKLHVFNPFISLIEKNNNPVTVWSKNHAQWKHESRVKTVKHQTIWMSVIHLENKVNEFTGFGFVNANKILAYFPINSDLKQSIIDNCKPGKTWLFQNLVNYWSSYFNFYFKLLKRYLGFYKSKTS